MNGRFTAAAVVVLLLSRAILCQQPIANHLIANNNAFAFDLYANLTSAAGNIFVSPYSISSALAMAYAGARGNTEKQMAAAMHFSSDQKGFNEAFGKLQERLNEIQEKGNVKLSMANSLWMQKDYVFLPSFLELTEKNYAAAVERVDYKTEAEKARAAINQWVEQKTNDKIRNLIPAGAISQQTRMVLANAIYFKGPWATRFDSSKTATEPFWQNEKTSVKVKMMSLQEKSFRYGEDAGAQILDMPYAGNQLSMTILLPKKKNGMGEVETGLTATTFDSLVSKMRQKKVNVSLPRFTVSDEYRLGKILEKLGITDAFSEAADFSGLCASGDVKISDVFHKAFVDVNEGGTEAAAASAVITTAASLQVPSAPVVFRADHPFLFFIRDTITGSILFMGKIMNPMSQH